ncbi:hypothetical protein ACW6B4_003198 [Yersinia ruckeri]|uniref:hypothetical protein n=1 Tax=Yersinia ruckeri TaxID=29486 RepID=UPI00053889BF|nr:hypothetical protein [Yersinia ruckeri]AUQ43882.1 hypothetical protein NJ56_18085 [Yersinia ruckeri]WMS07364.1 hypothetical protein RDY86_17545 [Yersinia ruckeri]
MKKNIPNATPKSSDIYGEEPNPYSIDMAEGKKGAAPADFECYGFDSLKALQEFRKSFPEKMKNEYCYQLSTYAMSNGRYQIIGIVSADHYKQFVKKVKASGINI